MVVIRTAQKQDFKFLSKIFSLNVPTYFDKKELYEFFLFRLFSLVFLREFKPRSI